MTADAPVGVLRTATPADAPDIDALMKASVRDLFPSSYSAAQTASSVRYIAQVDHALIDDGTYLVIEADGQVVACGGWSRRDKLFSGSAEQEGLDRPLDPATEPARVRAMFVRSDWTRRGLGTRILDACQAAARAEGFRMLSLMATLPGYRLYAAYGFAELERLTIELPDRTRIECVRMTMAIR